MLNRLQVFMQSRNGIDGLGIVSLIAAFVVYFINLFAQSLILSGLSIAMLGYTAFRVLSRSLAKRHEENNSFLNLWNRLKYDRGARREKHEQSKLYKFFSCPSCKNKLRVPKGKGKLKITCPKCGQRFDGKT